MTPVRAGTAGHRRGEGARGAYHHGDLERALVAEALVQVRARGADDVSLRQVAQAVGVSPSAAYTHFPDKTALMEAVCQEGMAELDSRMVAAGAPAPEDDDAAVVRRFRATGEAYVLFAVEEPHLFRHLFGPASAGLHRSASEEAGPATTPEAGPRTGPQTGEPMPAHLKAGSVSYQVLCRGLDELEARGLLRPGAREGLDMAAWTMVHGFASLVLDGFLPLEAGGQLIDALSRLALTEQARSLLGSAAT